MTGAALASRSPSSTRLPITQPPTQRNIFTHSRYISPILVHASKWNSKKQREGRLYFHAGNDIAALHKTRAALFLRVGLIDLLCLSINQHVVVFISQTIRSNRVNRRWSHKMLHPRCGESCLLHPRSTVIGSIVEALAGFDELFSLIITQ